MSAKKNNTFTVKIDLSLAPRLEEDLKNQGFILTKPLYTIFSAQKKGIVCSLYSSGSLVVQGKDKEEFIEFYLEPEILKNFAYTNPEAFADMTDRIGVDEAGKGDFFGPLSVVSCFGNENTIKKMISLGVKDSKKFSDSSIIKMAKELKQFCTYDLVIVFPEKYNELYEKFKNLNLLLGWAHASAIYNLVQKTKCSNVIIDQFADKHVVENAIKRKNIEITLKQAHRAESDPVVAAASILARAAFLEGMEKLSQKLGADLPKGASSAVIDMGIKIAAKFGKDELRKFAKLHFKTYSAILEKL